MSLCWRWVKIPTLQRYTGDFDIYHCTHHLMPPTKGRPRVLTVYDLRRYRHPHLYPGSRLGPFERAVRAADHFIAISEATKNDLQDVFGIASEQIDVVYLGGALKPSQPDPLEGKEWLKKCMTRYKLQSGRFFVAISSPDKRKNISQIVRAFSQVAQRLGRDYRLVIVGPLPNEREVFASCGKGSLSEQVIHTGPLEHLSLLLGECRALVYTSLYEGFGLPILEAMAAGSAVITSNCSSMPEVAGTAALLVDPLQTEQTAEAMVRLAEDQLLREQLVAAGAKRAQEFSWQRMAKETLAVYRKLT